jgi:hypothetical protein
MNTKVFAIIAFATLSVALITTAATTTNAFAHHHHRSSSNSQSLAQVNNGCSGSCSNIGSQIQGDGNSVSIASSQ